MFGTGSIPRERINFDSLVCGGETLKSLRVYHVSGEETTIHFYSSKQDEKVFMGQTIIFAWIDEQSEKEDELVSQANTRTQTTKGQTVITAKPEVSITDLYKRCSKDTTGKVYFQNATLYDAPHFSQEDIDDFIATTPYHQREMRSKEISIMGVGAIYPYRQSDITCTPFSIPGSWRVLAPLDFGYTRV
ncbi:terminase large subunit domain-containing protein [Citrobacter arsenatis]|uniref:terminase large subunit domain-containing protein n=1 Tax=Citrobacter arsenatis TaxID=2546350 RepID=UPI00300E46DB